VIAARGRILRPACGAIVALLAAGAAVAAAAGPTLLAEEAQGGVEVTDETVLTLERLRGQITIVAGEGGKLQYSSEMGGATQAPLPVALWLDGTTFRIVPPVGAREVPVVLQIWVPPAMSVILRTEGSVIRLSGLQGSVQVSGPRNRLEATGVEGPLTAEIDSGTVVVAGSAGTVTARGRELNATVDGATGEVSLRIAKGSADVKDAQGGIDGDFDGTDVKVTGAGGFCRLRVRGGRAEVTGLERGGDLSISGATLKLEKSKGAIALESDTLTQFRELEGTLRVTAAGGAVRGSVVKGSVEVQGNGAEELQLQSVSGPVTVDGAGLGTRLSDLGGEVTIRTTSAAIQVENTAGPLTIVSDHGNVTASQITNAVKVKSRVGDVRLSELNGPVDVDADGGQVDVSWLSMGPGPDSSIVNNGGGVTVQFPAAGGCRVEAVAKYGRIEASGLPLVTVVDDGAKAQGNIGRMSRPLVKIVANGDIRLVGAAGSAGEAP
jgi:DUF4097 and DUF4098 domain-containing protein YvlB